MEDVLRSILQFVNTSDLELLLLRWGKIFLGDIDFNSGQPIKVEEILTLFKQRNVSFYDVSELDLLWRISNPRRLKWQSFELKFDENEAKDIKDLSEFYKLYKKCLLKFGYYDIAVKRPNDQSFWSRISKPESSMAAYLIYHPHSQSFLCGGHTNLRKPMIESLISCIGAKAFSAIPLYQSIGRRKSAEYSQLGNRIFRKRRLPIYQGSFGLSPQPVEHFTLDTSSALCVDVDGKALRLQIGGMIEFSGTDVMKGLRKLCDENLAVSGVIQKLAASGGAQQP